MTKKKSTGKRGGGKKSAKKKSSKARVARDMVSKPTLLIDTSKLSGNSFKVGKKAKVMVSGIVVEESIRDYETKGRKSFRMEIDRVSALKKCNKFLLRSFCLSLAVRPVLVRMN